MDGSLKQDLDHKCEELISEKFNEQCNFDVDDAIHKLEKLGIVYKVNIPRYSLMFYLHMMYINAQLTRVNITETNDIVLSKHHHIFL